MQHDHSSPLDDFAAMDPDRPATIDDLNRMANAIMQDRQEAEQRLTRRIDILETLTTSLSHVVHLTYNRFRRGSE